MAFSNSLRKIMRHMEEGNKAEATSRRCPTKINRLSAQGADERNWMSSVPLPPWARHHRRHPPQGAKLDLAPQDTVPVLINVHLIYTA